MSKVKVKEVDCAKAQGLMSPYIDSMATLREAECLELHLSACRPCQRQLQSLISMRGLLARMEKPSIPQDLVLESRVRLSRT